MYKHITLRMPLRILWHSDQTLDLREKFFDRAEFMQPLKSDGRMLRLAPQ